MQFFSHFLKHNRKSSSQSLTYISVLKIKSERVSQAQQIDDLTKDIHQGYCTREREWDIYIYSASTHKVITIIITLPVIINIINYIPAVL